MGPSLVKVNDKIDSNMDLIPPGVMPPLVKAKGIDDVPAVTLTLWSKDVMGTARRMWMTGSYACWLTMCCR